MAHVLSSGCWLMDIRILSPFIRQCLSLHLPFSVSMCLCFLRLSVLMDFLGLFLIPDRLWGISINCRHRHLAVQFLLDILPRICESFWEICTITSSFNYTWHIWKGGWNMRQWFVGLALCFFCLLDMYILSFFNTSLLQIEIRNIISVSVWWARSCLMSQRNSPA